MTKEAIFTTSPPIERPNREQAYEALSVCIDNTISLGDLAEVEQSQEQVARHNFFVAVHDYCDASKINTEQSGMITRLKLAVALDDSIKRGINPLVNAAEDADVFSFILDSSRASNEGMTDEIPKKILDEFYATPILRQQRVPLFDAKRSQQSQSVKSTSETDGIESNITGRNFNPIKAIQAAVAKRKAKNDEKQGKERHGRSPRTRSAAIVIGGLAIAAIVTGIGAKKLGESDGVEGGVGADPVVVTAEQPSTTVADENIPKDRDDNESDLAKDVPNDDEEGSYGDEPEVNTAAVFEDNETELDDNAELAPEEIVIEMPRGSHLWNELEVRLPVGMSEIERTNRVAASLHIIAADNGTTVEDLDVIHTGQQISVSAKAQKALSLT